MAVRAEEKPEALEAGRSSAGSQSRGTSIAFLALSLVWGGSFLFMKVALEGMAPAQVAIARMILGAIALGVLMLAGRHRWPREPRVYGHLMVSALTFCVIPFQLFAWAGTRLPSGLSSIYNATTPLMTMLMVLLLMPGERLTRAQVTGLVLGALGVMVILQPWQWLGDADALAGTGMAQFACLAATASYGVAFAYTRRFVAPLDLAPVPLAATQVTIAAAIGLALAPFVARGEVDLTPRVLAAILALGVLGTGVAYVWNQQVIRDWGATSASTVTYLAPIVAVVLGFVVLGERLAWYEPVGAAIVLLGILIGQGRFRRLRP